jgi:hypothetical protein
MAGLFDTTTKKKFGDPGYSVIPDEYAPEESTALTAPTAVNPILDRAIAASEPDIEAIRQTLELGGQPPVFPSAEHPLPKELQPLSVRDTIKRSLIGMAPIVGPAYRQHQQSERDIAAAQYQAQAAAAQAQWKQKQEMVGKVMEANLADYKEQQKLQKKFQFLKIILPNASDESIMKTAGIDPGTVKNIRIETMGLEGKPVVHDALQAGSGEISSIDAWGDKFIGAPGDGKILRVLPPMTNEELMGRENPMQQKLSAVADIEKTLGRPMTDQEKAKYFGFEPAAHTPDDMRFYIQSKHDEGDQRSDSELAREWRLMGPNASAGNAAESRAASQGFESYKYHNGLLETAIKPVSDAITRFERLEETIAAGTPQADALVAPELLTVMAGGMGSGLRMNEAEIARIIGGRSNYESLQAALNKWKIDPSKALSITPAQRQQIRTLMSAVKVRMQRRLDLINDARDQLVNTDDPQQHKMIYSRVRRELDVSTSKSDEVKYVDGIPYSKGADGKWHKQ